MQRTKIITSGFKFVDIDAFACVFAYLELLRSKNEKSIAIITAKLNSSITKKYQGLDFYQKMVPLNFEDLIKEFVLVDVSDPDYFERFVDLNLVSFVFDHHPGFGKFWEDKIGSYSVIKPIGAAATLVYNEYKKQNLLGKISPLSAELLGVAIISNSLNFCSEITKEEDRVAWKELKSFFDYRPGFEEDYFLEVQKNIEENILYSLENDSKQINSTLFISQLEVWDSRRIIDNFSKEIIFFSAK